MRHVMIVVLLVFMPFCSTAEDSRLKPDGRMWQAWSTQNTSTFIKAAYVQGAMEGLRVGSFVGYLRGRMDEKSDALEYVKPCLAKDQPCASIPLSNLIKPFNDAASGELATGGEKVRSEYSPNASVLDVVRQMDKFYADYRNTPVCMVTAVQESIDSLRGNASSEEQLKLVRGGCTP